MTAEGVESEENRVQNQHQGADTEAEMPLARCVGKPQRFPRVMRQQQNEQCRQVKKVTVDILQDQRKITFAQELFARLAHRTVDRIGPKRLVVSPAIVVAGKTKPARRPQNKKCR